MVVEEVGGVWWRREGGNFAGGIVMVRVRA